MLMIMFLMHLDLNWKHLGNILYYPGMEPLNDRFCTCVRLLLWTEICLNC